MEHQIKLQEFESVKREITESDSEVRFEKKKKIRSQTQGLKTSTSVRLTVVHLFYANYKFVPFVEKKVCACL